MKKTFIFICLLTLLFGQCRQKEFALGISGQLSDSVFGGAVGGVNMVLQMQKLEGGVFNATYQTLASTSSDANGNYEFSFERENVVDYRITTDKIGYLGDDFQIDPENLAPDDVFTFNIALIPKSTFDVHLFSMFPQNEFDTIRFRNLAADYDCACCDSEERIFGGTEVDTVLSCNLYGESWIKYYVEIEKDTAFHTYIDSLFCPAFGSATLELPY